MRGLAMLTTLLIFVLAYDSVKVNPPKIKPKTIEKAEQKLAQQPVVNEIKKEEIPVLITAYSPSPEETDSTPFITASNKRVKEGFVAVSHDIYEKTGFGKEIIVIFDEKQQNSCGAQKLNFPQKVKLQIEDKMNKRLTNKIDIFFFSKQKALILGVCKGRVIITKE